MTNQEISNIFEELANLLEIKGDNPFKIRAYRNAARTIATSGYDFEKAVKNGEDLSKLPDIGEKIAKKIEEIVKTGHLKTLDELKQKFPPHILDLLKIEGIGPKRAKELYEELGIASLDDLQKYAQEHKIRELPGFSEKLENKILKGLILYKKEGKRFLYSETEVYAKEIEEYLKESKVIEKITIAGSYRRRKETVGDLDIVTVSNDPLSAIDYFTKFPKIKEIVSKGDTRSTIILSNNLQIDLRCVSKNQYGSALHYFTGSKAHDIKMRKLAIERGWKINEYGVFDKNMQRLAGKSEEEIYSLFGMEYIEPELREDRGEIEAAQEKKLPKLVNSSDIKGDLHIYSDIKSMDIFIKEALKREYKQIAFTLEDKKNLEIFLKEIEKLKDIYKDIKILKAIDIEIDENGTFNIDKSTLKDFDISYIYISKSLGKESDTARLIKAIDKIENLTIISHPTGRIIEKNRGRDLDWEKLLNKATESKVAFEIDGHPDRIDIDSIHAKMAKEKGIKLSLSSLARKKEDMDFIRYALYQARRGWIENSDLIKI